MKPDWGVFDRVYLLTCPVYERERLPSMRAELERVGLADRTEVLWCGKMPMLSRLMYSLRRDKALRTEEQFSLLWGHYRSVKIALARGASHVLVLEDDCRFLKDLDMLAGIMSSIPADYDYVQFEWTPRRPMLHCLKKDGIVEGGVPSWIRIRNEYTPFGSACRAFSRKGMEWFSTQVERSLDESFSLRAADCYAGFGGDFFPDKDVIGYLANPVVAIQSRSLGRQMSVLNTCVDYRFGRSFDAYAE